MRRLESFWTLWSFNLCKRNTFLRYIYIYIKKNLGLVCFSSSLCLSHPSIERVSGAICRPRSIPKHWGSQRCYFSKLPLSTSCRVCAAAVQGKVGNFWGPVPLVPPPSPPCRLPPQGQPFEGVITAACITWVTADRGWSQLMKPLKKPPLSWFLLKFWRAGARPRLPDNYRHSNVTTVGAEPGLHFDLWWVEGAPSPCLRRVFAILHYRLLFPLSKKWNHPLHFSLVPPCLQVACTKWVLHVLRCTAFSISQNWNKEKGKKKNPRGLQKWTKLQNMQLLWCHPVFLLRGGGGGGCKVKWDREPWQCGGNSVRGFAAPGTHLFLRRVPADTLPCWHTVKLDCGKHHHAETDKRKNRRCFYFQIFGCNSGGGEKLLCKLHFHFLQVFPL